MKRISAAAAVLALLAAMSVNTNAWGINPGQVPASGTPQINNYSPSLNPALLPSGLGYTNPAIQNDPFLSPTLYNPAPIYPNMGTTSVSPTTIVPNPDPNSYPDATRQRNIQPNYLPPSNPNTQKKWRLGVYSKDLDTGVKIMDVVNGGAAQRAGLEVNDLIVCVSGYQVGYVNGQLYDCATEFDRNADQNGWVNMLVQNSRNGQLQVVPIQLDSRLSTLRGTIALPNRQNLPSNALINVELKEVVGNSSQPVTFASTQLNNFTTYPIPFAIDVDPARLSQQGRYIVTANMIVSGREVYRATQNVPPFYAGQPQQLAMQMEQVTPNYGPRQVTLDQDAQVSQIVNWFKTYLGRDPSDREISNWLAAIRSGTSMAQVQQELLASNQFWNSCNQDKRVYVERVHELLVGQRPTQDQLNYWMAKYDNSIARRDFARDFQGAVGIQ